MDNFLNSHCQLRKDCFTNLNQELTEVQEEMKRIGSKFNQYINYFINSINQLAQDSEVKFFAKYKPFYQQIIGFKKQLLELNYAWSQINVIQLPNLLQSK
jgi:hypothetical protein